MSEQSEFSLIQRYFEQLTSPRDDVVLGIGDDCALLQCPADHVVAVSIDTLVEGVHFFADVSPETLGHKSLAVGLSDLAAMGATPAWFTLALSLPDVNEQWLQGFSQGLAKLAQQHNIHLVGGDTTRGPLTISIQVHGFVKAEKALQRSGAKMGDMIYVSGTLGDAGAALRQKLNYWTDDKLDDADKAFFQQRLEQPTPRNKIGQGLVEFATSAIDISDGLLADLGHILAKSKVGARLDLSKLPLSPAMTKIARKEAEQFALQSGDDYELCFTVPPHATTEMEQQFQGQCTQIGIITDDDGLYSLNENDELIDLTGAGTGYDHFK
ncbi:MAG: thiamine-phosphate kinase [Gammaproteobacteria bacterium]|nr:thiamine-phosphate kinase [Gammaproteobacteria bacterium]